MIDWEELLVASTSHQQQTLVLGGGISGLAAARALQERGDDTVVLEACPSAGGLTRTVRVGEFCFDYTGHLLHLSRYGAPSGVPYAALEDDQWQRIDRRSFCYMGGRLVPAPVQYHMGDLPEPKRQASIQSYERRPPLPPVGQATFRDFVTSGFGEYLAEQFLIPQNVKTMAIDLGRLSLHAIKRFFPPPDEDRVRRGMVPSAPAAPEYNSQFWYPKIGGIERLVVGLAGGVKHVELLQEMRHIDLPSRMLTTSGGRRWRWSKLFSSIPLKTLCEKSNDPLLRDAARRLSHSSTIAINLGLRGELAPELAEAHWIYVPDRAIPFYRVGFYSNISRGMCPPGHASLYVEVGTPGDRIDEVDVAGDLQPRVLQSLRDLGWVRFDAIACVVTHVMRCAYVHHTPEREAAVAAILHRLAEFDVHPIGRYGLWDYMSMEDSIHSAIEQVNAHA